MRNTNWDMRKCILVVIALSVWGGVACGEGVQPVTPGPKDRCAVCGMFTAPYVKFASQIIFEDETYLTFDGPKDLLKY